jgi:hypothetical protein
MSKKALFALIVTISTIIIIYFFVNSDDFKDKKVWVKLQAELNETNIAEIQISGLKDGWAILSDEDKLQFTHWLRAAEFEKSNRIAHGPTPSFIIKVIYHNKTIVYFTTVGGSILETSPRHIDPNTQFFVNSASIGEYLKTRLEGIGD